MTKVSIETIDVDKHRLRWREAGRHRSKTINGTRRHAERVRADLEDLLAGGASTRAGERTLKRLSDEVFERRSHAWSDKTLNGNHWLWQTHIEPHLGSHRLDQLRPRRIEDWIAAILFNHLFSGADAYVAANLWDFKANIGVVATPNSAGVYASLRLR
jgi:hypothetical protein